MRRAILLLALLAAHASGGEPDDGPVGPVSFRSDVQPIFERRCQPCHFPGGTMHAKLPFDEPQTIVTLGTKVFSRIKDEREQAVIRRFLAESAKR
jgi:hypothetical protein